MKQVFLFFIMLLTVFPDGIGQELPDRENDTIIVWTEDRKLTWDDFQSAVFDGTKAAQSEIGIDIISIPNGTKGYEYAVITYFYKFQSSSESKVPDVLKHEQVHFDIAELFARKMRYKIKQLKRGSYNSGTYHRAIDEIYQNYSLYQEKYDKETKHSILSDNQKQWEKKIADELREMNHSQSKIYRSRTN